MGDGNIDSTGTRLTRKIRCPQPSLRKQMPTDCSSEKCNRPPKSICNVRFTELLGLLFVAQALIALIYSLSSGLRPSRYLLRCSQTQRNQGGRQRLDITPEPLSYSALENIHVELESGGRWRPKSCTSLQKVALVVPFRNRDSHLRSFLAYMHYFLQKQQMDYGIFVVEQSVGLPFNRGMLLNIGFVEALKQQKYDCFVFHDVDMLPEDDRNRYTCTVSPRLMSVALDYEGYKPRHPQYFGGVTAFSTKDFLHVNGYSNMFFGWGAEDDDMFKRITQSRVKVARCSASIGRYTTLSHKKSMPSPFRYTLLKHSERRRKRDGLSALNGSYVLSVEPRKLFTLISVQIKPGVKMNSL